MQSVLVTFSNGFTFSGPALSSSSVCPTFSPLICYQRGSSLFVLVPVALTGLFVILGPSALAGVAVMILVLPATYWVQRKTGQFQDEMMKQKDSRVKLLNEALQAIRVVKFFAWEEKFAERIEKLRASEVKELLWIKFMGALTYALNLKSSFSAGSDSSQSFLAFQ